VVGAIAEAERLASQYGITKGDIDYTTNKGVFWHYPPAPTEPPAEFPWGYPTPNSGQ
jgi:hypothetical protein